MSTSKVLVLLIVMVSMVFPRLWAQEVRSKASTSLKCTVSNKRSKNKHVRNVNLADFRRLHCEPSLEYFSALEELSNPEYSKFRNKLKWDFEKTITFKAGVTSGSEAFEIAPGVEAVRVYSAAGTSVNIRNAGATAVFVEGLDIKRNEPVNESLLAFIAVPPNKERLIYRIEALVADPVWSSGNMKVGVLEGSAR